MQYIKRLKRLLTSNFVISFTKAERQSEGVQEEDLVKVDIELVKRCYVCNKCQEKVYADANLDKEDDKIKCEHCSSFQLLKDSERWGEYKK